MDTRSKIASPARAVELAAELRRAGRAVTAVTGYFDPVRYAAGLPEPGAGGALFALVLPSEEELLPQRARAEMAAALRAIYCVVMLEARDPAPLLEALQPSATMRLEDEHARRARELMEHVRRRCQS